MLCQEPSCQGLEVPDPEEEPPPDLPEAEDFDDLGLGLLSLELRALGIGSPNKVSPKMRV